MSEEKSTNAIFGNFHLTKWFLDFSGENGEAMIFYAARLTWHGWSVSYISWLNYNPLSGVNIKSGFRKVQFPQINDNLITWSDSKYRITGTWEPLAGTIQTRIFDSPEGYIDWECYQPASRVRLQIGNQYMEGFGYAEQLIVTVPPWKIPMDQLRWGHFGSNGESMVWIELREKVNHRWLWLNSQKIENCTIEDDHILLAENDMVLYLDQGVILESEKKISTVAGKIIQYIPGFNKIMPASFLMADETKWLSKGRLHRLETVVSHGIAIHEMVNFKADKP